MLFNRHQFYVSERLELNQQHDRTVYTGNMYVKETLYISISVVIRSPPVALNFYDRCCRIIRVSVDPCFIRCEHTQQRNADNKISASLSPSMFAVDFPTLDIVLTPIDNNCNEDLPTLDIVLTPIDNNCNDLSQVTSQPLHPFPAQRQPAHMCSLVILVWVFVYPVAVRV